MRRYWIALSFLLACGSSISGQSYVYVGYVPVSGGIINVMLLDVETCTYCDVATMPLASPNGGGQYRDILVLPDGRIIILRSGFSNPPMEIFTPPSQNPVVIQPPNSVSGMVIGPDGTVYVYGPSGLYVLNLVTNNLDFVGAWPAGINFVDVELYVYNGNIFGVRMNNPGQHFQIDVNDPSQSFLIQNVPLNPTTYSSVGHFGDMVLLSQGPQFHVYDPMTGVVDSSCNFIGVMANTTNAISAVPENGPLLPCMCMTDAGSIPTPNQVLCANETLNFTNTGGFLDNNDLKQYVLFTNPGDTVGSIVAISSTPSFDLTPPLVAGVTYYFAAMAGDNLNGSVDLNDPCLDFSNARTVLWRPLPTVALSAVNPDVCPGACTNVAATFAGTAPFTLTYAAPGLGPTTQTFSSNTGTFQVCVPANAPAGGFSVQATALTDAFCTCQ